MRHTTSVHSARRGRPFQKGDDPRRNKGAKSQEAQSFAVNFANALATGGDPKALSALLWEKALRGQPWAVEILLDRLIGKPKENEGQPRQITVLYASDPIPGDSK